MFLKNSKHVLRAALAVTLAALSGSAWAVDLNMPVGVTPISHDVYHLHMYAFWMCVGIGVVVFSLMIFAMIFHRKAAGHQAAHFHENTLLEVVWTIIPFIILIALAIPAAKVLVKMTNTSDPDLTIKIEGYQWKWQYDYLQQGFSYFSMLAADSDAARMLDSKISPFSVPHYLRDVDHPMVVPTGKKIRLLITANDVIHSWYVPDFAFKVDAIPGFVNQGWIKIDEPGTYRGGCTELCGRGHGFMPIVVVAESPADYQKWLAAMKASNGVYINPQTLQPENTGSPVEYAPAQLNFNTPSVAPVSAAGAAPAAPAATAATPAASPAAAAPKPAAAAQAWTMASAMARGKQVFDNNCASCHMPDGKGNSAMGVPAIAGGPVPNGPLHEHIELVLHGKGIMPAWGNILSDSDLAAVITFERNAFGNHGGGLVSPADIAKAKTAH
ncbi:MAG: cytochrome c oxidase subunit II [Gammaproteobacteria bacterium]|nr:cytochrome c oxidase subunit II [Gammaproteobacteria bacterium]MBU6508883.1 cytochrome c oxidase subunit II [Gammaproteobacteria bacterium]MDE1983745.1 cytochrome c oxidase subunit II [Gammaproteobacteria bacterium]MDE2108583.1 cytochrome c oxidase subunit II [Gammaproteobacteria bacterium]